MPGTVVSRMPPPMLQKSRGLLLSAQAAVTMTAAVDLSARLAEILADPSFEPELLARALADIDDTPRTLAESDERLARRKQRRADMGIAPTKRAPLKMPPRADQYDCLAFGASCRHTLMVDGTGIATPLPCGKCEPDREWKVFLKMVRYRHRITEKGHAVTCPDWPFIDDARRWAAKQGERVSGTRMTLLRRTQDYCWEAIIIYPDGLSDHEWNLTAMALNRARKDAGRIGVAPTPERLLTLISRDACVEGRDINPDTGLPIRRRTCVFTGWPDYDKEPSDHLHDDGYTETGIMQTQREPTPLPGWAQMRAKLELEERAALNAADWCDGLTDLDDYVGPSALVSDVLAFITNRKPWRECYRPMLRLLGAENKAPPTVCQGCERPAQLTPKGLCIRCALLSS